MADTEKKITKIKIGSNTYVLHDGELDEWREGLDYSAQTGKVVTSVSQSDGKISVETADLIKTIDKDTANDTSIATSLAVKNYVEGVAKSLTQMQFKVVSSTSEIPVTAEGQKYIYFVKHEHTTGDSYDEYIVVNTAADGATASYSLEKIGNTDISLDGLVTGGSATFKGTADTHTHTWSMKSGSANYEKTTGVTTTYGTTDSTKSISITVTPSGTVSHTITGSTAKAIATVTANPTETNVVTDTSLTDSYSDNTLTLTFSKSNQSISYVPSVTTTQGDFVNKVDPGTSTFTGTSQTISVKLPTLVSTPTNTVTGTTDFKVTGTNADATITPQGTIDLKLNTKAN